LGVGGLVAEGGWGLAHEGKVRAVGWVRGLPW
jgi:hypothetical protein